MRRGIKFALPLLLFLCATCYLGISYVRGNIRIHSGQVLLRTGPYHFFTHVEEIQQWLVNCAVVVFTLCIGHYVGKNYRAAGLAAGLGAFAWFITGGVSGPFAQSAFLMTLLALLLLVLFAWMQFLRRPRGNGGIPLRRVLHRRWFMLLIFGLCAAALTLCSHYIIYRGNYICTDVHSQMAQAQLMSRGDLKLHISQPLRDVISFPYATLEVPSYSQFPPGQILIYTALLWANLPLVLLDVATTVGMVTGAMWLAGMLAGRTAMLVAGMMLLGSPHVIGMAGSGMNHNLAAFLLTWVAVLWMLPQTCRRGAGGGFLLGYAVATRPLTALAQGAVWCLHFLSQGARNFRGTLRPLVCAVAGAAAPVAGLMLYNYATTGSALRLQYSVRDPDFHKLWFRTGGAYPYQPWDAVQNLVTDILSWNWLLLGWPIGSWFAAVVWWATTRFQRKEVLLLLLIGAQVLVYRTYHFHDLLFGPRFLYELVPYLAVLFAAGIARGLRRRPHLRAAGLLLVLGFSINGASKAVAFWSSKHSQPVTMSSNLHRAVRSHWPPAQPTVFLVPLTVDEKVAPWFRGPHHEEQAWFILAKDFEKARRLPELRNYKWISLISHFTSPEKQAYPPM